MMRTMQLILDKQPTIKLKGKIAKLFLCRLLKNLKQRCSSFVKLRLPLHYPSKTFELLYVA